MWIKEPEEKLTESLNETVNFLYKENNIYIMDNHLAAGWSWLNEINPTNSHYFLHIDRHYDLLDSPTSVKKEIIDNEVDLKNLTFQQYLDLRQTGNNGDTWPLFRWDNYIINLQLVYPDLYDETFFATFKDGNTNEEFVKNEMDFLEMANGLEYLIKEAKTDKGWIINLDIDYFFNHVNDNRIQIFSDDFIVHLSKSLKKILNDVKVLTICLSPECCGGWNNALRITNIICEVLEIDFNNELNKIVK